MDVEYGAALRLSQSISTSNPFIVYDGFKQVVMMGLVTKVQNKVCDPANISKIRTNKTIWIRQRSKFIQEFDIGLPLYTLIPKLYHENFWSKNSDKVTNTRGVLFICFYQYSILEDTRQTTCKELLHFIH